jgi:NDP-sugar pyrophosphorylase family protein
MPTGNLDLPQLTTAVVFCGGKATRLDDTLRGLPKALVKVASTPYILGLLITVRLAGIRRVVLCISPHTLSIVNEIASYSNLDLEIDYSIDSGEVEAAGALFKAYKMLHTDLLLCVHGDVIVDVNYKSLLNFHVHMGAVATLVASERKDQPHTGATEVSLNGWVKDIYEAEQDVGFSIKPSQHSLHLSNSGIYVLDRKNFYNSWSKNQRVGKLEQGILRTLAHKNMLAAYINGDNFSLDIGTPERLKKARESIEQITKFFPAN